MELSLVSEGSGRKRRRGDAALSREAELSLEVKSLRGALAQSEVQRKLDSDRFAAALQEEAQARSAVERRLRFTEGEEADLRSQLRSKAETWQSARQGLERELAAARGEAAESAEDAAEARHRTATLEAAARRQETEAAQAKDDLEVQNRKMAREMAALRDMAAKKELPTAPAGDLSMSAVPAPADLGDPALRSLRMKCASLERQIRRLEQDLGLERQKVASQVEGREALRSVEEALRREKASRVALEEERAERAAEADGLREFGARVREELLSAERIFGVGGPGSQTPPTEAPDASVLPSAARLVALLRRATGDRCGHVARVADAERQASMAQAMQQTQTKRGEELERDLAAVTKRAVALEAAVRDRESRIAFFRTQAEQRQTALDGFFDKMHSPGAAESSQGAARAAAGTSNEADAERERLVARIASLEGQLAEALDGSRMSSSSDAKRLAAANEALGADLATSVVQAQDARAEVEAWKVRVSEMELAVARQGISLAPGERVVHAKENPITLALRDTNAQLREQIQRLQAEVKGLGEGAGVAAAGGGSGGVDAAKLRSRLKSMFAERVKVLREAVYLLTGWKLEMATDREHPQLRLRSMYAEAEDDCLLFAWTQPGGGGGAGSAANPKPDAAMSGESELQLLETPFAANLDERDFVYLEKFHSVPAFLSHVTLQLAERQTVM